MARRIQRQSAGAAAPAKTAQRTTPGPAPKTRRLGGRVRSAVITDFTIQLATLTDAGIPVVKALKILEGQTDAGPFKDILIEITDDVSAGAPLSEAMRKHGRAFDDLYASMVRAGEAGGILDRVLDRLATFREKAAAIRSKIRGALIYPAFLVAAAITAVVVVVVVVIPKFREIFDSYDIDLPDLTQLVLSVSDFAAKYWYVIFGVPIALFLMHVILVSRGGRYRYLWHAFILRLPLLGSLQRKSLTALFSRTFGTLVQAGVPHLDALEICRDTSPNDVLKEGIEDIRRTVREGEGIARPMGETGLFDDVVTNMVDVGEETGELDGMLLRIADAYDVQVERRLDTFFRVLEPVILICLAGVIFVILMALVLPISDMMSAIGSQA